MYGCVSQSISEHTKEIGQYFLAMIQRPRLWGMVWVHICLNYIYFVMLAWMPYYLTHQLGASLETAAILSTLPYMGMAGAREREPLPNSFKGQ